MLNFMNGIIILVIRSVNQTKRGNMRNYIFITFIILLVTGCADKQMQVKEGSKLDEKPAWAMNMGRYDKGIGAVGVARYTKLGTQRQINQAGKTNGDNPLSGRTCHQRW